MSYYGYQRQYDPPRRSGFSPRMIMALILAGMTLISYFGVRTKNPVTHKVQHIDMSVEQEIGLGLQAAPRMAQEYGGASRDAAATEHVRSVGGRIVQRSDAGVTHYQYHFTLLRDPDTVNAFALPGGQVFITEGLYRKLSTDGELAGVLGHEIGHVVGRHSAEHLAKERLTQGLTGAAVIASYDPNNPRSRQSAMVAMAIGQLVNLRFSRDDELEADQLGVRFMAEAGYDPRSMVKVMHVLEAASKGGGPPEFFSTHPNPEHRITRIQRAIRDLYPQGVPNGLEP